MNFRIIVPTCENLIMITEKLIVEKVEEKFEKSDFFVIKIIRFFVNNSLILTPILKLLTNKLFRMKTYINLY